MARCIFSKFVRLKYVSLDQKFEALGPAGAHSTQWKKDGYAIVLQQLGCRGSVFVNKCKTYVLDVLQSTHILNNEYGA